MSEPAAPYVTGREPPTQERFLSALLGEPVTVFTLNGARVSGPLVAFDLYTLQIGESLVLKSGLTSVQRERRSSDTLAGAWKRRGEDTPSERNPA